METELPVLRLGLAGFGEAHQKLAADAARAAISARATWQLAPFAEADAWWIEGSRTHIAANGLVRVQPGVPSARAIQLSLNDVDRPIAFTLPLEAGGCGPALTFDLADRQQAAQVLHRFAARMQALLAQFSLGSSIAQHQPTLGAGSWEVLRGAELLAVVDLRLGAGVAPTATPADFASATWCIRDHGCVLVPAHFARTSVSQLMWNYALRTQRDLLPPHYRQQPLYFRRPPRLRPNQLRDAHLLLLRELDTHPGLGFGQLQQVTGLGEAALARHLSALYVVGSITANPRRAHGPGKRLPEATHPGAGSVFSSELDAHALHDAMFRPATDRTAPAPLGMEQMR